MIDVFEALGWLNEFDVSHLSPAAQVLIAMSRDVSQTDAQIQTMIRNLRALARASRDPLEVTEITLHRAALQYWKGFFPEAIRLARRARERYPTDPHRGAVARWILGMAQWRRMDNNEAYSNWNDARQFFKASLNVFRNLPTTRNWYEERLREIEIDLATKPEEIYTWLNEFEPTKLSAQSRDVINQIEEKINQRDYINIDELYSKLQDINRWSTEVYERPEAYFECGFAAYQTGALPLSIDFLELAVPEFAPGIGNNHRQVISRWMLGAVEWMGSAAQNRQAMIDWRRCILELEQLRLSADRNNEQTKKKWYADRRDILQAALSMLMRN